MPRPTLKTLLRLPLTALAVLALAAATARAQPSDLERIAIRVLPQAEVFGEHYTLGEIAEFDGFDLEAVAALAKLDAGRSPLPGRSLRLSRSYLLSRLQHDSTIDMGRIDLEVPEGASVVRSAQRVGEREIEAIVLKAARDSIPSEAGEVRQELETPLGEVLLPKGDIAWDVSPMGVTLAPGGQRSFRVEAKVNGQAVWRNIVRVKQSVFQDVVIATRPLGRNQRIAAEDVTVVRRDLSQLGGASYLSSPAAAVGMLTKRPLNRDELLEASLLEAPVDVREGGRVTLEYRTPGVVLQVPGVALVGARMGQFIPVRNLQSGKVVHGTLQAADTVSVN
ncbi:MAG: flagellar basal body P-ring formation protein FlgA [Candidatus Lambdaproteobacteria bacterium]|nr:flagellar basal body P-ring formation protein FlgA [Candidatus Lambdaproteobacteria bacterium]